MLSPDDARALVAGSRLFDEEWYAAQAGETFGSRAAAVAHWVAQEAPWAAPHPLVEPVWLFPGGRWRGQAPDPLSFLLSGLAGGSGRTPHPCYPQRRLGPLEDWLADHDPAELLPRPEARAPRSRVVLVVPATDLQRAVAWVRHAESLDADLDLVLPPDLDGDPSPHRRVLEAFTARRRRVRVGRGTPTGLAPGTTRVTVGPGLDPPPWPWLGPLVAAAAAPGVGTVQPVLVGPDATLVAPVLVGHPVSTADPLDGVGLPGPFPGISAAREPLVGDRAPVLCTRSWVPGPTGAASPSDGPVSPSDAPAWAALERRALAVPPVDGLPSLRWAIDIAAPANPSGRRWGDWHFARSLAAALRRLGQQVEIDHPQTRDRATREGTEVALTLRGLRPTLPQPGATTLLWVISHPEDVTPAELAGVDRAFAASTTWAARHGIEALPQCTDTTRFHPGVAGGLDRLDQRAEPDQRGEPDPRPLVVANARGGGGIRPAVAAAREAGVPIRLIGSGWAEVGIAADAPAIDNADLPAAYARAPVVLADHHDDMRETGFVANRVLDVLAVGGRLLVDDVAGLDDLVGPGAVAVWRTPADVARLARPPYDAWPDDRARLALAERVVAEHSFDARAETLLRAALDSRG